MCYNIVGFAPKGRDTTRLEEFMIEVPGTKMKVLSHSSFSGVQTLILIRIPVEIDTDDTAVCSKIHLNWRQNRALPEEFEAENQLIEQIMEITGTIYSDDFSIVKNQLNGDTFVELMIRENGKAKKLVTSLERLIKSVQHHSRETEMYKVSAYEF